MLSGKNMFIVTNCTGITIYSSNSSLFDVVAGDQAAVHPPSIEMIAPVMERAMSPLRYSASAAISSTVTNCLVG
jgi:hypothetical protein